MEYGFITNKNMILDYNDGDDYTLQAWYLNEQIDGAPEGMVVVYDNSWGDYPPTGISIVSINEFIESIEWTHDLLYSINDDEIRNLVKIKCEKQENM